MDRQNVDAGGPAAAAQPESATPSLGAPRDLHEPDTMTTITSTGYANLLSHMKEQSRTTIPRRQLPPGSTVVIPNDIGHQSTAADSPMGKRSSAPLQAGRSDLGQQAYELPPIKTDVGPNTLAALIFGAHEEPSASPPSEPKRNRPRKGHEGLGVRFASLPPSESELVNQSAAVPDSQHSTLAERRSMCQSPSWEAYDRRKKEKKEKEIADKEANKEAKAKKRRLSKQPPSPQSPVASPTSPVRKSGNYYPPQSQKGLVQTKTEACKSDSALVRPRRGDERPASVVGLSTPDLPLVTDIPAPSAPRARSRSSSFSSLFKAPFESRRSSIDQRPDEGFIGGVKLEQHRVAAHQRVLNEQAFEHNSDIHPATRKDEKRSASPLRFLIPRSEQKETHSRAYPPIAIRTSGRNQALLAPESTEMREGFVQRWRGRLRPSGQKPGGSPQQADHHQDRAAHKQLKSPSTVRDSALKRMSMGKNMSTPVISAPFMIHKTAEPIDDEKLGLGTSTKVDLAAHPAFSRRPTVAVSPAPCSPSKEQAEGAAHSGSEVSEHSFDTAPSSPPPPPRRSSKRKSLIGLGDSASSSPQGSPRTENRSPVVQAASVPGVEASVAMPKPRLDTTVSAPVVLHQRRNVQTDARSPRPTSNRWSMSDPPSIPYDSVTVASTNGTSTHPKRGLKQAAMTAFERSGLAPPTMPAATSERPSRSISPNRRSYAVTNSRYSLSTTDISKPSSGAARPVKSHGTSEWKHGHATSTADAAHSSEESCSEGFRTSSSIGTPDTSRPQSERGAFPAFDNEKGRHHSGYTSVLPSPAFSFVEETRLAGPPSPLHLDPIQAAAFKVQQAFPDVPAGRPDCERRGSSEYSERYGRPRQPQQLREQDRPNSIISISELAVDSATPKDELSAGDPWPATYLEAARRAAPSAPAPTATSKSLSPSLRPQAASRMAPAHSKSKSASNTRSDIEGIAKMFVECCGCKYFHDMPSKLYEVMAHPEGIVPLNDSMEFSGSLSMTVKCPWCKHEMSTRCCAGLAAMVYVQERLH